MLLTVSVSISKYYLYNSVHSSFRYRILSVPEKQAKNIFKLEDGANTVYMLTLAHLHGQPSPKD